jgi:hypothetical protein
VSSGERTVVKLCGVCGAPVLCVRGSNVWPIGAARIVHVDQARTLAACPQGHPVEWVADKVTR